MIEDFNSPEDEITSGRVGGKFYHLYVLNKIKSIRIPQTFCITSVDYDVIEVDRRLNAKLKYAVRSSAAEEDATGKSAAGIFESYLNIPGTKGIHNYIQKCFNNVNSSKVHTYLKIEGEIVRMRVIVQEMVNAEKSGVLFTRNPVTGTGEFVIQSKGGLAEDLVSGRINPNTLILPYGTIGEKEDIQQLLNAAGKIRDTFNKDMDIEWAWDGQKLFILQARPLTIKAEQIKNDPSRFWTRANIGEIIPKPLTPLSWSIFREVIFGAYRIKYYSLMDRILTNFIHLIPRKPPEVKSPKMINGYLYLNLETIFKTFGSEPWVDVNIMEAALGFKVPANYGKFKPDLTDHIYSTIKKLIFYLELIFPWASMERRVLHFVEKNIAKKNERMLESDQINLVKFIFGWHMAVTARSFSHLGLISKYLKKRRHSEKPIKDIVAKLSWLSGSINQGIRTNELNQRIFNEFELADFDRNSEPGMPESTQIHPDNEALKSANKFWILNYFLKRMNESVQAREKLKILLVQRYQQLKYYYLDIAQSLFVRYNLENPEDIFFLEKEEINGEQIRDINTLIVQRKSKLKEFKAFNMPDSFYGDTPELEMDGRINNATQLKGTGCSSGRVSGIVKIAEYPDQIVDISEGQILVTRFADPGWTPYLLKSKGVITQIGGILSHLATIARENQIPMIVGAEETMRVLRDGEKVSMDGETGIIKRID